MDDQVLNENNFGHILALESNLNTGEFDRQAMRNITVHVSLVKRYL